MLSGSTFMREPFVVLWLKIATVGGASVGGPRAGKDHCEKGSAWRRRVSWSWRGVEGEWEVREEVEDEKEDGLRRRRCRILWHEKCPWLGFRSR